jgi:hypothetical protein
VDRVKDPGSGAGLRGEADFTALGGDDADFMAFAVGEAGFIAAGGTSKRYS